MTDCASMKLKIVAIGMALGIGVPAHSSENFPSVGSVAPDTAAPAATINEPLGLPYSTQWEVELTRSYLYVSYNSSQLSNQFLKVGSLTTDFGRSNYGYPSMDFFSHLFSLAAPASQSFFRNVSLWGRYSLGFTDLQGTLSSQRTPIDSDIEKASLLVLSSRIDLLLGYEGLSWIKFFGGIEIAPYFYRNTADLPGAEQQGGSACYGGVLGAHLPVFFGGKGSLLAEYRRTEPFNDQGQIFGSADAFSAGVGVTF